MIPPPQPSNRQLISMPKPTPTVTGGVAIPAINTNAMETARTNNEIPFAVLHFLQCVPLLVRVLDFGDQSLLRPANKDDFLALRSMARAATSSAVNRAAAEKISVPIVAAVYQTLDHNGTTSFAVMPPKNIYKFNSNLHQLTTQDAVFSMALNPPPTSIAKPPSKRSHSVKVPPLAAPKRKVKPNVAVSKRSKNDVPSSKNLPQSKVVKSTAVDVVKSRIIKSPQPVVVQPVPTFEVIEQEHLSDTGDISEAIQGFATGSFLSPKRRPQVNFEQQINNQIHIYNNK